MRLGLVVGLVVALGWSYAAAAPSRQDLTSLSGSQIQALQRRLVDAHCYSGPIDGRASPALTSAVNSCPDQRPKLIIETGMSVSLIQRVSNDKACKLGATVGLDKTVRIWSLPDGRLLKTLRPPIGYADYGKLYATAMSPDGHYVAVGGLDARNETNNTHSVYVFDVASGTFQARLGNYPSAVFNMAWSGDGHWLAVSLASGSGLSVIDTSGPTASEWPEVARDKTYAGHSLGTAFGPDGRLFTAAYDGKLRAYEAGPSFRKIGEVSTRGGKNPYMIAVDPRNEMVAAGFIDAPGVELFDAKDLHYLRTVDTKLITNGTLNSVAWSSSGARLFAGGQFASGGQRAVVIYDRAGKVVGNPINVGSDTVLGLQSCGTGVFVGSADPAVTLLDGAGAKSFAKFGVSSNMKAMGDGFALSPDGRRVRFSFDGKDNTYQLFDLGRASLEDAVDKPPGMLSHRVDGLGLAYWEDQTKPTMNGKSIRLDDYETSRSLAIRSDGSGFVLGTEWNIRNYDAKGNLIWKVPSTSSNWSVNLTGDNRVIVAGQGDGTVRWRRSSDGAELLALFVNKNTRAWVAWTPSGYYSASPGGEDMIGWNVNRGWDQAADFFPADRFRGQYSRPDVVDRILSTLDEAEALHQADADRPIKAEAKPILDNLPPVISILSPADGYVVEGKTVTISYIIRSPSGLAVDSVEARVDGRPLPAGRAIGTATEVQKCLQQTQGLGKAEGALQGCRGTITIDAPDASAEIGIAARAGARSSEAAILRVTRTAPAAGNANVPSTGTNVLKPKLYALVIGVADYVNPDYALKLAAKDAGDFKAALENQRGGLYSDVTVRLLRDREATSASIREGLDWLSRQTTSRDVAILYFAGHGEIDQRSNRFYILPAEADAARLFSTAISREDISAAMEQVPGKAVVFLDACHSGAIANGQKSRGLGTFNVNDVVKDLANADNGLVLFTAATGKQLSLEDMAWGNGAFTKALVEGLGVQGTKGKANMLNQGAITLSELETFVAERVKQLTDGAQSPVLINPKGVPNFPLAVIR